MVIKCYNMLEVINGDRLNILNQQRRGYQLKIHGNIMALNGITSPPQVRFNRLKQQRNAEPSLFQHDYVFNHPKTSTNE